VKGVKEILKMALALTVFAAVACVGLAVDYMATKGKIEVNQKAVLDASLTEIFGEGTEFIQVDAGVAASDSGISMEGAKEVQVDADAAGPDSGISMEGAKEVQVDADATGPDSGISMDGVWLARKDGAVRGVALRASVQGFNDAVTALVGVKAGGEIAGVRILKNTDTPGLGANASSKSYFIDKPANKVTFYGQFAAMRAGPALAVRQDGGEVVAITAATVTSRAVSALVAACAQAGQRRLELAGGYNE
jgi:electron transport complex protein RnfG